MSNMIVMGICPYLSDMSGKSNLVGIYIRWSSASDTIALGIIALGEIVPTGTFVGADI